MSPADPAEGDDPTGRPADVAAAFEDIVAGLRAEGGVPSWPEERAPAARQPRVPAPEPEPDLVDLDAGPEDHDDHFVPPEPPPLPRLGQAAAIGVALLAVGVLLLVSPDLLGLSETAGLPLGLITVAGGLSWLVLRSWSTDPPPDDDDPDDGAVV